MIKWFDVDKFLPGRESGWVLIRHNIFDEHEQEYFVVGKYHENEWVNKNYKPLGNEAWSFTHWAHINEPYE